MKRILLICLAVLLTAGLNRSFAQVGIGTTSPETSSMLDVTSTAKGMLIPRMTIAERNSITSPANGLMVYCTDNNHLYVNKGSVTAPNWILASTPWLVSGSDAWYSGGKIGIGTTPAWALDVLGDLNFSGTLLKNGIPVVTGVSAVTASLPLSSSGGSAPNITISQADASTDGYLSSTDWTTFNNKVSSQWFNSGLDIYFMPGNVGVGFPPPATNLHVAEANGDITPAFRIEQQGSGDASMEYQKSQFSICTGIHTFDNSAFKICEATVLTGGLYSNPNQLFRIQTQAGLNMGITDINHQSRARAHLIINIFINPNVWTTITFQNKTFDEHNEYYFVTGQFIAKQEGYYQVNARVQYNVGTTTQFTVGGFVSIAIFKNSTIYAEGNNLQIVVPGGSVLYNNNAPNVSDVLYLQAGDAVEIKTYQSYTTMGTPASLMVNHEKTYFSVHKIS